MLKWIESMAPIAIRAGEKLIDGVVAGEKVGTDAVKGIKAAYALSHIYLDEIVANTETKLDDQGLVAFQKLCEDTAQEGGFTLPKE